MASRNLLATIPRPVYSGRIMKTRRVGFYALALWLGFFAAGAQIARADAAASTNRHSLWKANGRHCTLYLLGSIHFLKPENYPLPPEIERAFTNSQTVVFETDIGIMEKPEAIMGKLMAKAMLPPGETLQGQLSPATYRSVSNYFAASGLPLEAFAQFKPGMVAMTIEAAELKKLGFEADQGLDVHFFRLATQQHKTIVPLETIDFQLDLFTELSKEEGELFVKTTLDEIETTRKELGDLVTAWGSGDAAGTEKVLNASMKDAPGLFKRLLTDRNVSWMPKLQELLAGDKNVIVIVGAGHLVGKEGVVELLRAKGVKMVQE